MISTFLHKNSALFCLAILLLFSTTVNAQYCTPAPSFGCFTGDYPTQFAMTGTTSSINDPSLTCSGGGSSSLFGGYQDRTAETCAVASPSVVNGTITGNAASSSSSSSGGTIENMQIFVDWNSNGTFETSESVGGLSTVNTFATAFTITVPSAIATGDYRMRLIYTATSNGTYPGIDPCMMTLGIIAYTTGEAIDYTIHVGTSTSCGVPTGLAATSVTSTSAVLNWAEPTGSVGSEYVVSTVSSAPTGSGTQTTALTYSPTGLTPSTVYYAWVRDSCGASSLSAWVSTTFTTTATVVTTCNPVTGLTVTGITTNSAVLNWTAVSGSLGYQWVVNTSAADPTGSGTNTTLTTATATGLSPTTAYYAHVRDSCGVGDFSAWVTVPFNTLTSTCPLVVLNTPSAITTTSATISWTAISGSAGYVYVVDNSVTPPTGGGTFTTLTSVNVTGLTSGTTYYAHVRDSCSAGNESAWVTTFFTTLAGAGGCNAVTSLTASGVTSSSAVINWTMASGAIGAEYVVDMIPTDPTGPGTGTTASTYTATGHTALTTYYAHVRDSCGATSLSAWVTIPIVTTAPAGVASVASGDFNVSAFPNPVKDELTIKIIGAGSVGQVELIDISGKMIRTVHTDNSEINMSMNGLPSGIYFIRYIDATHTQTIKISKQ